MHSEKTTSILQALFMNRNVHPKKTLGIIGGSTVSTLENCKAIAKLSPKTPFGKLHNPILKYNSSGVEFYFISRHGQGHTISPSEINYRANIYALKELGVTHLVSISAVGSLKEEMKPGDIVFADQYMDWTRGVRKRSFYDDGMVGHISAADPVDKALKSLLECICCDLNLAHHKSGAYLCIEGPQFSSRVESNMFRTMGASIVGMTNLPEAYLALEAGIGYVSMCMVTDYDAWKEQTANVDSIVKVLAVNKNRFYQILSEFLRRWENLDLQKPTGHERAFFTNKKFIDQSKHKILEVLFS